MARRFKRAPGKDYTGPRTPNGKMAPKGAVRRRVNVVAPVVSTPSHSYREEPITARVSSRGVSRGAAPKRSTGRAHMPNSFDNKRTKNRIRRRRDR